MMSVRVGFSVTPLSVLVKRATTETIGEPSVNDRKACRFVAHCGWNAIPSNPPSELAFTVSEMKVLAVGFAVFGNTRRVPPFCNTNHRESSPGACSIATGWLNVRFDGRASRPTVGPGGAGGGVGSSSELWHASSNNTDAMTTTVGPNRFAAMSRPCFEKLSQCCIHRGAQNKGTFVGFQRRNFMYECVMSG